MGIKLSNKNRAIYIGIRAEQIKEFQDKNNGHLFTKPYSIEMAREIAERQLNYDLSKGLLRISLEELLLNDNDTCIAIHHSKTLELAKQLK